ncbi:hypothetical protein POVWA2_058730 [Plasmodium ovale wallikeri]|uniref:Uncharacterized protein n=1 Tax=Plasmodium ovale wallikeri TaxID=864142 RepID=A0A1A8ZZN6_PLAOA|nr:hypothetical protein POVWA1_059420 [Plasmodium ovale wallikeri]SBT49722.1 hypothetical protein POVWA2_058730 [Plasmodium ovale wallikeri]
MTQTNPSYFFKASREIHKHPCIHSFEAYRQALAKTKKRKKKKKREFGFAPLSVKKQAPLGTRTNSYSKQSHFANSESNRSLYFSEHEHANAYMGVHYIPDGLNVVGKRGKIKNECVKEIGQRPAYFDVGMLRKKRLWKRAMRNVARYNTALRTIQK